MAEATSNRYLFERVKSFQKDKARRTKKKRIKIVFLYLDGRRTPRYRDIHVDISVGIDI